jgi:branched-chain amino acid transport system permease protein
MKRLEVGAMIGVATVVLFALMPFIDVSVPAVLPGDASSAGSLQILGIALVYVGVAISYDLVFGYTGLLSLGHAMFFAFGVYGTNLLMERAELSFAIATLFTFIAVATSAALIGAIALRVRGIAFAMVTLAFAEALTFFLISDPLTMTGGEEGLAVVSSQLPDLLRGVVNVRWVFWMALVYAVAVYLVSWFVVGSHAGRTWQAIRENEDRAELLGLVPFRFKLLSFTFGAALAGLGGSVYLVLARGASPTIASADFTLALVIMVVIGGAGRLWGAALGGLIYGLLTQRLTALGTSGVLDGLPDWIERTISEPLFVLGVLFIVLVLFAPGGVASLIDRVRAAVTTARR